MSTTFPDVGKEMLFPFDYRDEWLFKIKLIRLGRQKPHAAFSRVVKRVDEAPPQHSDVDDELDDEER